MERHNPFRPNINVLNKLIVSVKRGEKIALVGGTGSGKSTVIKVKYINTITKPFIYLYLQLIQRLYNLEKGDMRIENANIDAVNVPWLRSKLGLVSQVII